MGKTIVIKGADFGVNAIPKQVLIKALVIKTTNAPCPLRDTPTQGTIVMYSEGFNNTKWGTEEPASYADKAKCELNSIPFGAKTLTVRFTGQTISVCAMNDNYVALLASGWQSSGVAVLDLTAEPSVKYFSCNIQTWPGSMAGFSVEFGY